MAAWGLLVVEVVAEAVQEVPEVQAGVAERVERAERPTRMAEAFLRMMDQRGPTVTVMVVVWAVVCREHWVLGVLPVHRELAVAAEQEVREERSGVSEGAEVREGRGYNHLLVERIGDSLAATDMVEQPVVTAKQEEQVVTA